MVGKSRIAAALTAALAVGLVACSDDGGGSTTASGAPKEGTSSSSGGAAGGGATEGSDAKGTLYERLGKKEGIAKALTAIVDAALMNPDVASYFFFQVQDPVPAGHPTRAQIEECLTLQLSAAAGGPETYPATVSGGFTCRSMAAAHAGLGIPPGTFDDFVTIAAGVLKGAGVADEDIGTIGTVLVGTKADVAQDTSRERGPFQGAEKD